ncbi:DUF2252 domain-containing protein [Rothia sp. CCM 9418]|uniref:DUF2252 domain-containing protein n=1 Tax=Rothia sp. CCM 9418 TaxID=3402661 RepID=UPI003AD879C1
MISTSDVEALLAPPARETDPLDIIMEQNKSRLTELVPVRIGRMSESPFAYYRGTAGPMAADLATRPNSGVFPLICGDAHIGNFGYFASPERNLLFDLNDFDEAGRGPFEWDLKRLATSVYLAAIDNGENEQTATTLAEKTSKYYRRTILRMNQQSALDRYYERVNTDNLEELIKEEYQPIFNKFERKARNRNSEQALHKFTVTDDHGNIRIVDQPPLTLHTDEMSLESMRELWQQYLYSARPDIRYLLRNFRMKDHVLRVVGVGSVGTRCFITLLQDQLGNPLFIQVKEAQDTVLHTYGKIEQTSESLGFPDRPMGNGFRVVAGQRVMQSQSDAFLGWITDVPTRQGTTTDYYVRQFRDMKGSINISALDAEGLKQTAKVCASLLARAHAQSRHIDDIAVYCEADKIFDVHMGRFAHSYAQICTQDFRRLHSAVEDGKLPIQYAL